MEGTVYVEGGGGDVETAFTPSHIGEGKLPPEEEKAWFLCGLQMGQPKLEVGVTPSFGGPVSPH